MAIHDTAMVEDSTVGDADVREYATLLDAEIGDGVTVYERTSVKHATIAGPADVNANCFIENATLAESVQVGPNTSIVGVTHPLSETGMTYRNDVYEEVVLEAGSFVGAGAVVLPGVTVGENAVVGAGTTVVKDVPEGCIVRDDSDTVCREL
jgi:acetyltransferase-like isoleucine patch superfamily enzyme